MSRLKPLLTERPASGPLARTLAAAYLAEDNRLWARRVLLSAIAANRSDCESRAWLAWLEMEDGYLELASEVLAAQECPQTSEERGRYALLRAYADLLRDERSHARLHLGEARAVDRLYPEDLSLLRHLRGELDPGWLAPVSARLELSGGGTSNAIAGAPNDASGDGAPSPLVRLDGQARLVVPFAGMLRPTLEGQLRLHGVAEAAAADMSYLETTLRPGLIVGRGVPRVTILYVPGLLLMSDPDQVWFSTGHRLELEGELPATSLFAGAGRRFFAESGRTRWELDGGLGKVLRPMTRVQLMVAMAARYYVADEVVYDQAGGTALLAGRVGLYGGAVARLGLALAADLFPSSGGSAGQAAFGIEEKRLDLSARLRSALWSPPWQGIRVGLLYELGFRDSTAAAVARSFEYTEHRALVGLRWSVEGDPLGPAPSRAEGHLALPHALQGGTGQSGFGRERIRDLLRQEESELRGRCGCGA